MNIISFNIIQILSLLGLLVSYKLYLIELLDFFSFISWVHIYIATYYLAISLRYIYIIGGAIIFSISFSIIFVSFLYSLGIRKYIRDIARKELYIFGKLYIIFFWSLVSIDCVHQVGDLFFQIIYLWSLFIIGSFISLYIIYIIIEEYF